MKNQLLKAGDLVKYNKRSTDLESFGLIRGQIYEVFRHPNPKFPSSLIIKPEYRGAMVVLVDENGELTEFTEYVTKVTCPVVLSRGAGQ